MLAELTIAPYWLRAEHYNYDKQFECIKMHHDVACCGLAFDRRYKGVARGISNLEHNGSVGMLCCPFKATDKNMFL